MNKTTVQGSPLLALFAKEPHINIEVRRDKLYSDSFTELASPNIGGSAFLHFTAYYNIYTRYSKEYTSYHGKCIANKRAWFWTWSSPRVSIQVD